MDNEQRDSDIVELRLAGRTLQQIADIHGLTRERVRQIIKAKRFHRRGIAAAREARREARLKRLLDARMAPYIALDRKCVVCGTTVMRGKKRLATAVTPTCSTSCTRQFKAHRSHYDPMHSYRQYASVLKNASKRTKARVRAAYRFFDIPLTPDLERGAKPPWIRKTRARLTWTNVFTAEELGLKVVDA